MMILDSNLEPGRRYRGPSPLKSALHTLAALIAAPIVGGGLSVIVSGVLVMFLTQRVTGVESLREIVNGVALGAALGGLYGTPVSLLLGWPGHRLLVKLGRTHPLAYSILFAGVACSAFTIFAGIRVMLSRSTWEIFFRSCWPILMVLGIAGAIGGLVFWRIRRPDRM